MQIIIKTLPYKNDSYCSHLVEHCVFSWNQNSKTFFEIDNENNATSHLWYTNFYIPDYKDIDKFINHILQPIDKTIIAKEKIIIKEEILENGTSTWNKLVNKLGKIVYGKSFKRYKNNNKINQNEIKEYHQKHYNKQNLRILDDNFNIIKRPKIEYKKNILETKEIISPIKITTEWKTFDSYLFEYKSIYAYSLCYFLEWIYNTSANYMYRYKWNEYYTPISHFFEYTKHLCFIKRQKIKIDQEFFELAKNNFLKNPININEIKSVHEILKLEIISIKEIHKIIQWLTYTEISIYIS